MRINAIPNPNFSLTGRTNSAAFSGFLKPKKASQVIYKKSETNETNNYIGFTDKNNNLTKDIRFDRRYNEIRAIEYQKHCKGFNFIQNGLTVSFNDKGNIRNIYLISKKGDSDIHIVLNDKHGLSITFFDKNKKGLSEKELNNLKDFFINYTKEMLKTAQENNLTGSKDVLDKFSDFLKKYDIN